ncbi:hypothetical protein MSAN_01470300 [Mycena sanguinolenta]|uniref:F-box domain-containing protein n=1 Tax=Mycena sanguinolenta TaxID=230812 RepID=A0A8H6Y761_9AGAR|nr:hypothetical protein MSAN_01470300 [Mycena sanguinolenta]
MIETLPVELIGKIVGQLALKDCIKISQLSRRMRLIASDPILNVWRLPILRNLRSNQYEESLKNLSVYMSVPRHNWIDILSRARAPYILFEMTIPNLREAEWEDIFRRRFLPSWKKWRKDSTWRAAFFRVLHQTWHRSCTSCTTNEAWTQSDVHSTRLLLVCSGNLSRYIVLNRNGSANQLEASSRNFNIVHILDDMRHGLQQNMLHLEMRARLVVQFADVRVLALGTLKRPSPLTVNSNANALLHPPGILPESNEYFETTARSLPEYSHLNYPLPAETHINYPFYTHGGTDKRWITEDTEAGLEWVGGLMVVTQILGQGVDEPLSQNQPPLQDRDLIAGSGRQQYVSFTWEDLSVIAPWLEEKITKRIDGPGLGL